MIANSWELRGSWALLLPEACSLIPNSLLDPLCLSQLSCKIRQQRKLHDKRTCLEVNFQCKLCSTDKFILLAGFLVFNLMCDFVVLPGSIHAPPGSFHLLQCAEDQVSSNHDVPHEMDRWVLAETSLPLMEPESRHWRFSLARSSCLEASACQNNLFEDNCAGLINLWGENF